MHDIHKFFLNAINRLDIDTTWRKNRGAIILFNTNNNIASSPIVHIIRECTNGMEYVLRIPALLEIYSFPFNYVAP